MMLLAILSFAGSALAQAPAAPQIDPRAPAAATTQSTTSAPRNPTPSRNQFFTPVMGINIEAQGVALPTGVAEDPLIKPPAQPDPASTPAATPK
jgi:hypothetical protein